jgi:hypothetical protein
MRIVVVVATLVGSSVALAEPPPPATEPTRERTSFQLRTGIGFGRYTENRPGYTSSSELQPHALLGVEATLAVGRGELVFEGQASFGTETHLSTTYMVDAPPTFDEVNTFRQEIYQASPRYRHPLSPVVSVEVGYRLLYQRLHFTERLLDNPDEHRNVSVHALEAGFRWRNTKPDGSQRMLALILGANRAYTETDALAGEQFSAGGVSANVRAGKRMASGITVEAQYMYRRQSVSNESDAEVGGTQVAMALPRNTTWQLLAVFGFSF